MLGKNYSEGSAWRRWDLHIHTPETGRNDQFTGASVEERWDTFIADINTYQDDISVIGITDYYSISNYLKFKRFIEEGKVTKQFDLVLPNIELRIAPITGSGNPINIHCIFNPILSADDIEDRFFNSLKFNFKERDYNATRNSLTQLGHKFKQFNREETNSDLAVGLKQFVPTFTDLQAVFNSDTELRENTIVIVANGKDGVTGITEHYEFFEGKKDLGLMAATRENIYQFCDGIFSSNANDVKYFLGKKTNREGVVVDDEATVKGKCRTLMPCFHGCDAHDNSKIFAPDNNLYCWIKADPTFEGLKQVLYEPAERVRIQENNPGLEFEKPIFSFLNIVNPVKVLEDVNSSLTFTPQYLSLNDCLISIIGGRGQGKSMLMNYLANGLGKDVSSHLTKVLSINDDFQVGWKQNSESITKTYKANKENDPPFTFIYQSKIKEIADDNAAMKNEIMEMLEGAGMESIRNSVDELEIKQVYQSYWNLKNWFTQQDDTNNLIHDKAKINQKIKSIQQNIDLVTEGSNKDLLERYVYNLNVIQNKIILLNELREIRQKLNDYEEEYKGMIVDNFNHFTPLDFSIQRSEIFNEFRKINREISSLEKGNEEIKETFKDFKGDLSQLLSNLKTYQQEIVDLQRQILEYDEKLVEFSNLKIKLNEIISEQYRILQDEAKAITDTWNNKIFDNPIRGEIENKLIKKILLDRKIAIKGALYFDETLFYQLIERYVDGRSLKPKTLEKIFQVLEISDDPSSFLKYTVEKIEEVKQNPGFYDDVEYDILRLLVEPEFRNQYIQVIADISIDGKGLNERSAGQKGTAYLCLKLATQIFSGPLIFDQPEDDLDNDFITNELIELFKDIKKFRQVIIISHNANLVVNSDSEQIIIAHYDNENLSYTSGSLENEHIYNEICRILEGGKGAFEKRRNKYRLAI